MKKFGVLFLILTMLIPSVVIYAETNENYEKLIMALDLIEKHDDGTFRGESYITNGEFFKVVYRLTSREMPKDKNEAQNEIIKAGILRKNVRYEAATTADDLLFAMVRILGYNEEYKKNASEAGLLKGVHLKDAVVTRSEFSKIIYNTLIADRMVMSEIAGSNIKFEKSGNLLEDVFNVKKVIGIVEADRTVSIDGITKYNLKKGEISLDGVTVSGVGNTKDYQGRRVEAFLQFTEKKGKEARALVIDTYKNDEIKLTSEFIDGDTTNSKMVWLEPDSQKMKKKTIPKEAVVIYNGTRMGMAQDQEWSLFTPDNGEVTLIDNDSNTTVDVVIIWNYISYVVDYVNAENEMIFDKLGQDTLNLTDKNFSIFDEYGIEMTIDMLKPFDVLMVALENKGSDEIIIRCSRKKPVKGSYMRDGYYIKIGEDEYSIGGANLDGIKNSDSVTAYIDIYNRIAYVINQLEREYGYLTKTTYENEVDNRIFLKMYTFDAGVKTLEAADSISMYDYSKSKEKTRYYRNKDNSFKVLYDLIKDRNELVEFRINANGQINKIIFCGSKTNKDIPNEKDEFNLYYGTTQKGRDANFNDGMFVSRYRVTANTKILSLEGDAYNSDGFSRVTIDDFISDYEYPVRIYDVNEKFEAGVVVVDEIAERYSKFGSLVEKVSTTVDADGSEILQFTIFTAGEKKTIEADNLLLECNSEIAKKFYNEKTKIADIKTGDVIYYKLNNKGKIASFAVLYKNKEQAYYHTSNYGWNENYIPNAAMAVTYSKVIKTYSDVFITDIDGAKPIETKENRNYYLYEKSKKKIRKVRFSEIKSGDSIVGLWKWSNMNDLIIYR